MPSRFHPWRSLKARVTILTVAASLAGLWSLALYASHHLREDLQQVLAEQQVAILSIAAAQIDEQVALRMRALELTARAITPSDLKDPAALQRMLDNRVVLASLFNGGNTAFAADGSALAHAPFDPARVGRKFAGIDHIEEALAGKASVGKPFRGPVSQRPLFGMAVPILDESGRVVGALSGLTNLDQPNFMDRITRAGYGRAGVLVIVDRESRRVVTSSDKRWLSMQEFAPDVHPLINRFIAGSEETGIMVNPMGMQVLASARGIPKAGWYVAVGLPVEEAFAPIEAMQQHILQATLAFTVIVGLLTWWILKWQLAPMVDAAAGLAKLADTDRPLEPLPVSSRDEIGDLVRGFNRLLETLAEREKKLATSEARSSAIARWAHDAIVTTDSRGRIVGWNHGAETLFGHAAADVTGKPVAVLFPAAESTRDEQFFSRLAYVADERLQGELHEARGLRRDGSELPVEVSLARWESGGEWFVTAIVRDVSRRREAERRLRESEEIFDCFMRHSPMYVFFKDEHLRAVRLSGNYETLLGRPVAHLLGRPLEEFFPPDFAARLRHDDREVFEEGRPVTIEEPLGDRVFATTRFPITIGDEARYIAGYAVDVTDRKRAENAARHGQEQLRQLAAQMNRNREAESSLLSRELHDEFGQILTSLKMDLSAVAAQLEPIDADLHRQVVFSMALIDASVDSVHRIAARLRPRILDELGLTAAIESLVQDFRERARLDAEFIVDGDPSPLSAERTTAVFRIAQESLVNIARHADARRVDVSLACEDGMLVLEVRDDGKGLREDQATSHESIGLLGMRERALAAGGELRVTGVPGKGTIVQLRLPLDGEAP